MKIGQWELGNNIFVAPMAGVTDRPFRKLCRKLGAGYAVSEMAASNPQLWDSIKTARRLDHKGEVEPIAVQLLGADPDMMAQAALFNISKGARIIDINLGCPAKKVCNVACGSALMRDLGKVESILKSVIKICNPYDVPVTLKTRTGWDREHKNALEIAMLAESLGVSAITIHGRTRADLYTGEAEYETIKTVKENIAIPVIANGDIDSPQKAKYVLDYTGADGLMIGRAAQGNPWIFKEINHYLKNNKIFPQPTFSEMQTVILEHLEEHYEFYGEVSGVKTARKHLSWYLAPFPQAQDFVKSLLLIETTKSQYRAVDQWFNQQINK
ncbi:tRNA dihydrouridine synthase DusB [Taylorella equigenitalis]|uniref:tRNA-dihydrouridine synthase B n=2 Tax=Taylorella equigenitalis TaxID=29575 RepID=A0A654KFL1_TAYEM|nr:tRNA dihydrouridine synthase DusB [Taylorella equigenitalis]ADU91223.1 tRNA dihydrouridine synthase B [Taylorella equigenitalis MCE9]AFN36326.1 tRNA-dihydrouridine synthase A [Taylorella equigenitalis ATCC 35865]ASY39727.1 tRNA dihydrouridine synthase DusB [Taylorella equigenitalis]ASY41173.1 tRNA dihydrouridine synthase DusB [Taylorella equigenitalis]WDU56048.1 tRNA dihydrouridine synthase DusB [Taylorella equigenitalis]